MPVLSIKRARMLSKKELSIYQYKRRAWLAVFGVSSLIWLSVGATLRYFF